MSEIFFKGWAKPGPTLPVLTSPPILEADESLDALSGHFRIFQYKNGHRFSTDDILTAWYGTSWCPSARSILDLGSGIGTVGMISAWRLQGARVVSVEAQEISVQLARKSVNLNGLENRYEVRQGDFRDPQLIASDEKFDLVLGSPPYFPLGTGVEPEHPQKLACRFEVRGSIVDYCQTASDHLDWGGTFAGVFPFAQKDRVVQAAKASNLCWVRSREIIFREGDVPLLTVFLLIRKDHLPSTFCESGPDLGWSEPPLIIRTASGAIHPEYSAIKLAIGFPP